MADPDAGLDAAFRRARAGDRAAFETLYQQFAGPLLGYLVSQAGNRQDAEDLLAEVFLAALKDIHRIEGDAGGFKAWLYRVATNRAIDLARRSRRRTEEPLAEDLLDPVDLQEQVEAADRKARIWQAVMALPDEQRRVVAMRLTSDLPAAEIAAIVGKTPGAVKALQHRALVNLAKALGAPYPDEPGERLEP